MKVAITFIENSFFYCGDFIVLCLKNCSCLVTERLRLVMQRQLMRTTHKRTFTLLFGAKGQQSES